jgi:DNA (cytosine-5)-methyltransferase 1
MNVAVHAGQPWNVLSLCSGVGGLDLGVKLAAPAARCVAYVEGEAFAAARLVALMQGGFLDEAPVWSDLRSFDGKPWRGVVDCVIGGIPCQPASTAGKRQGTEDPRWLWPHANRIIRECEPAFVFWENVPGLLGNDLLDAFRGGVVGPLEEMGYLAACGLFSAAEVGAGHRRERVFLLAHRDRDERWRCDGQPGCLTPSSEGVDGAARDGGHGYQQPPRGGQDSARRAGKPALDHPEGIRQHPGLSPEAGAGAEPGARLPGGPVGHPERPERDGLPERLEPGHLAADPGGAGAGQGGHPALAPPGPGDREAWVLVLARSPHLAPALSRLDCLALAAMAEAVEGPQGEAAEPGLRLLADGMALVLDASRTDQLRAGGNGVHPLAAGLAFRTLWAALGLGAVPGEGAV